MPYPIVLNLQGKRCVVIGAGPVAERRVLGLLAEGASVRVVAPQATEKIMQLAEQGALDWERGAYSANMLADAVLVFAATDHASVNDAVSEEGAVRNVLVCRMDDAAAGDFMTPAAIRRGDLLIAVTTGGRCPTLAAVVKERLEAEFGPEWSAWASLFGRLREMVRKLPTEARRQKAVLGVLAQKEVRSAIAAGDLAMAEEKAISCLLAAQQG